MLPPDERPHETKVVDRALLLYLLKKINECGVTEGDTKLQKIVFASETSRKGERGLNYNIIRWDHGPFSKELAIDKEFLGKNNLIVGKTLELTETGEKMVSRIKTNIERDPDMKKTITIITQTICTKNLDDILRMVYDSVFKLPNGKEMRIKDIPNGELMVGRSATRDEQNKLIFDDATIETLDIMMNEVLFSSLQTAMMMPATKEFKF